MKLFHWLKKILHIHIWHFHHFAGVNEYLQCRCKKRMVRTIFYTVYTPIDQNWLNGGEPDVDLDQVFRKPPPGNE